MRAAGSSPWGAGHDRGHRAVQLLVHGFSTGDFAPLNEQPELAFVIANVTGMVVSFRGTKQWAFREREARHADGGVIAFTVINLVTMMIPIGCLWLSRYVLGLDDPLSDNVAANVIGLLLGNAARFVLFRQYVFPRGDRAEARVARLESSGPRATVHACTPSSASMSRSSGRLSPTTLWWSPSMPVTNAPPRPSTVKAPGDVQRLAGRDVRLDLLVGEVGEVDGGRGGRGRDVPGRRVAQRSGRCAARRSGRASPATGVRRPSASAGLPSASPSSSSTESQPSTSAPSGRSSRVATARALELGQLERQLGRGEVGDLRLVDAGDDHDGLDARRRAGSARRAGDCGGEDQACVTAAPAPVCSGSRPRRARGPAPAGGRS